MSTPPRECLFKLRKVPVDQLRLGMHLQELCGAWVDHPFWKTKFVLTEAADLKKLQQSGVAECWIDVSKGHFDENVFRCFVTSLSIYPVGSMVRLRSGYLAVVTQQNPVKLTAPEVKVFFSTKQGLRMTPRVLDLAEPKCSDRIVGRESNEQWQFAHLDELWAGEEALQKLGRKG